MRETTKTSELRAAIQDSHDSFYDSATPLFLCFCYNKAILHSTLFHFALLALLHIIRTEFGVSTTKQQPDLLSWLQFATTITQSFSVRYTPLARRLQLLLQLQQIYRQTAVGCVGCVFVQKFNIFKSWQNHSISTL